MYGQYILLLTYCIIMLLIATSKQNPCPPLHQYIHFCRVINATLSLSLSLKAFLLRVKLLGTDSLVIVRVNWIPKYMPNLYSVHLHQCLQLYKIWASKRTEQPHDPVWECGTGVKRTTMQTGDPAFHLCCDSEPTSTNGSQNGSHVLPLLTRATGRMA